MTLSVEDVKKIVDSKVGGTTLTPAPTTFVEGRLVTPQIPTLCTMKDAFSKLAGAAGAALGEMKDAFGKAVNAATGAFNEITKEISGAIGNALTGVKDFIFNPIKGMCNEAIASLNAAIADLTAKIAITTDPTLKAALQSALADLQSSLASVNSALASASAMVGEKFEQLMAAMNLCKPEEMPGVKQYKPEDFTQTLNQTENIEAIKLKASNIMSQANTLVSNPTSENYTTMTNLRGAMNTAASTVSEAVISDAENLAGAQAQNDAMNKFMQMANGLNNDNTKDFVMKVTDPDSKDLLGRVQVGMANMGKVAGE